LGKRFETERERREDTPGAGSDGGLCDGGASDRWPTGKKTICASGNPKNPKRAKMWKQGTTLAHCLRSHRSFKPPWPLWLLPSLTDDQLAGGRGQWLATGLRWRSGGMVWDSGIWVLAATTTCELGLGHGCRASPPGGVAEWGGWRLVGGGLGMAGWPTVRGVVWVGIGFRLFSRPLDGLW
jgi:hypothetical protein